MRRRTERAWKRYVIIARSVTWNIVPFLMHLTIFRKRTWNTLSKTRTFPRRLKLIVLRNRPRNTLPKTAIHEKIGNRDSLGGALTTAQAHRTAAKHHPRRIALFGGSFDPIHSGHLSVARAADRRFNFDEIHFIPASRPPHKLKQHLAPFPHRFAMVALACTEHPHFVPSLAEAGEDFSGTQLHYSVDTVRYFRHVYHGDGDRLFFIIGADAFLDIPMWKEYETLLGLCDFIVANRPGIRTEARSEE